MKQEVLNSIRKSYNDGLKRRKKYRELLEELKKLEQDENVKKYIALKTRLDYVDYEKIIGETDNQILDRAFDSLRYNINETNDIYLCLGTFRMDDICDIEHGPRDIRLKRDDPKAEYRIYRNIEDGFSEQIPIKKCEEFEKKHKVIFPKVDYLADKYFYELQREFIKIAVFQGQKTACKKILCKYKINQEG